MPILKHADDKQPTLAELAALTRRADLEPRTKKLIEDEIWAIRAGVQGEEEAAYEIDFHYGNGKHHAVIHDLRVEVNGRVAQIDHLIINRALDVWICESKAFSQGVKINEHGEWSRYGGGRAHGMPSPVKQNQRHVEVLRDLFDSGTVRLPKRGVTIKPNLMPVVLVSNKARIDRPKYATVDGLETVIKVERLLETINRSVDTRNPLVLVAKLVGAETVIDLGQQLVALHRPHVVDWAAKFGLVAARSSVLAANVPAPVPTLQVCAHCGRRVSDKVAQFSLDRREQFGGAVLCFDCQNDVRRERRAHPPTTNPARASER
jgi:hypothetical protein